MTTNSATAEDRLAPNTAALGQVEFQFLVPVGRKGAAMKQGHCTSITQALPSDQAFTSGVGG
jgi:hypothetical protein